MHTSQASRTPLRELLAERVYWRWSVAVQLLRLPNLMNAFAYVLVSINITGSPALGGLLIAVATITTQVAAPFTGRVVDRLGPMTWAPRIMYLSALGRFATAAAFAFAPSPVLLVAVIIVSSTIASGSGGIARVVLGRIVPDRLLASALAIDSTVVEAVLISAPFVVAGASALGGVGPLIAMGFSTILGATLLLTLTKGAQPDHRPPATADATSDVATGVAEPAAVEATAPAAAVTPLALTRLWRNPRFVFWILVAIAFGHLLGTAEIGAFPIADELGKGTSGAAFLVAALGAASAVTGILYAWLSHRIRMNYTVQATVLLVLMIVAVAAIALLPGWVGLFLAFIGLGLCTAPINTVRSHAAGRAVPANRTTEAFSALDSANSVGYALAGFLLAIVPLQSMLALGTVTAIIAVASVPFLMRGAEPGNEIPPPSPSPSPSGSPSPSESAPASSESAPSGSAPSPVDEAATARAV